MHKHKFFMIAMAAQLTVYPVYAIAADSSASVAEPAASAENVDSDESKKRDLVDRMHKIRPARKQVEEAVGQVAANLPPVERDKFMRMLEDAFDYKKLDTLSRQTMMNLFTAEELQKMVDYFGSEEAKSIATKLPKYQSTMQPEITRMLDAAIMKERTGRSANSAE